MRTLINVKKTGIRPCKLTFLIFTTRMSIKNRLKKEVEMISEKYQEKTKKSIYKVSASFLFRAPGPKKKSIIGGKPL